jgi:hypothetical protein
MNFVPTLTAANRGVFSASAVLFILGVIFLLTGLRKAPSPDRRKLGCGLILFLQPLLILIGILNLVMFLGPFFFASVLWKGYEQCRKGTINKDTVGQLVKYVGGAGILSTLGLDLLWVQFIGMSEMLPIRENAGLGFLLAVILFIPLFAVHIVIAVVASRQWNKCV